VVSVQPGSPAGYADYRMVVIRGKSQSSRHPEVPPRQHNDVVIAPTMLHDGKVGVLRFRTMLSHSMSTTGRDDTGPGDPCTGIALASFGDGNGPDDFVGFIGFRFYCPA